MPPATSFVQRLAAARTRLDAAATPSAQPDAQMPRLATAHAPPNPKPAKAAPKPPKPQKAAPTPAARNTKAAPPRGDQAPGQDVGGVIALFRANATDQAAVTLVEHRLPEVFDAIISGACLRGPSGVADRNTLFRVLGLPWTPNSGANNNAGMAAGLVIGARLASAMARLEAQRGQVPDTLDLTASPEPAPSLTFEGDAHQMPEQVRVSDRQIDGAGDHSTGTRAGAGEDGTGGGQAGGRQAAERAAAPPPPAAAPPSRGDIAEGGGGGGQTNPRKNSCPPLAPATFPIAHGPDATELEFE